jgi:hypothetical protein
MEWALPLRPQEKPCRCCKRAGPPRMQLLWAAPCFVQPPPLEQGHGGPAHALSSPAFAWVAPRMGRADRCTKSPSTKRWVQSLPCRPGHAARGLAGLCYGASGHVRPHRRARGENNTGAHVPRGSACPSGSAWLQQSKGRASGARGRGAAGLDKRGRKQAPGGQTAWGGSGRGVGAASRPGHAHVLGLGPYVVLGGRGDSCGIIRHGT